MINISDTHEKRRKRKVKQAKPFFQRKKERGKLVKTVKAGEYQIPISKQIFNFTR